MLASLLRGSAQLFLNLAILSEESLDVRFTQDKLFREAVTHDLTALADKETKDVNITQADLDLIKTNQTQITTDLVNDGTAFQKGLHDLKDSFQAQLAALAAGNTEVDLTGINATFAALHQTASTMIDFGTQAGGTVADPPPPVVAIPPVVEPPRLPVVVTNPDGSTTSTAADGTVSTTPPIKTVVTTNPDGSTTTTVVTPPPVPSTTVTNADGSTTVTFVDGSTVTTPAGASTSRPA